MLLAVIGNARWHENLPRQRCCRPVPRVHSIRFGELAALRVGRLDLMRRRATIAESVTEVGGRGLVWGTPKGHERRNVPVHRFLIDELAAHVVGKAADALVFTAPHGGTLRVRDFRRVALDPAAKALGIEGLHPHALRTARRRSRSPRALT